MRKIQDTRDEVYYKTLLAMYWIAKEEIPNKKFTSLLSLFQQLGLEDIKYSKHRSADSIREMFLLIGSVLKRQLVDDISRAKCVELLTGEVCPSQKWQGKDRIQAQQMLKQYQMFSLHK